ncbi:hypothetical protein N7465_002936 [Penicillium sp. CMV-2018d]|nr:hypothetical protein N7465_002936 [Penicillium sp. CMV-2018d]
MSYMQVKRDRRTGGVFLTTYDTYCITARIGTSQYQGQMKHNKVPHRIPVSYTDRADEYLVA